MIRVASLFTLMLFVSSSLLAEESCIYMTDDGMFREAPSLSAVPEVYQAKAKCQKVRKKRTSNAGDSSKPVTSGNPLLQRNPYQMAKPEEIELSGNLRKDRISSSIGPIELRWPRSAEGVLGKNPLRATADAARMVSKTLLQAGFPGSVNRLDLEWKIVFMDENVPSHQVPMQLITNCHPAWMTPPSNIYMVVQRIAAGCGGGEVGAKKDVDAKVAEVLAHEMGHVVEAALLGKAFAGERFRSEGFATWFESLASEHSRIIPKGSVIREHKKNASKAFSVSPDRFVFRGSANDYARASMYFHAIVKDRGVKGLMRIYEKLQRGEESSFMTAMKSVIGWDRTTLEKKAQKIAFGL